MYYEQAKSSIPNGISSLGSMPWSDAAKPIQTAREVPEQMERLEKALTHLECSLGDLVSRLEGVLRPVPPSPTVGCAEAKGGPCTSFGGHLFHLTLRLDALGNRLLDVQSRLEL